MGSLNWSGRLTYSDGAVRAHQNAIGHEALHNVFVDQRLHDMVSFIPYCILYCEGMLCIRESVKICCETCYKTTSNFKIIRRL